MAQREIARAHERGFERRTTDHRASWHETAGAYDCASASRQFDHAVEHARIGVVIGGIHEDERRGARGKSRHHRAVRTAPPVAHEIDGKSGIGLRVVADGGRSIVIRLVIADQHARRRSHRGSQRRKRRNDVAAFIVNWDDDVEAAVIAEPAV